MEDFFKDESDTKGKTSPGGPAIKLVKQRTQSIVKQKRAPKTKISDGIVRQKTNQTSIDK